MGHASCAGLGSSQAPSGLPFQANAVELGLVSHAWHLLGNNFIDVLMPINTFKLPPLKRQLPLTTVPFKKEVGDKNGAKKGNDIHGGVSLNTFVGGMVKNCGS